ncbi:GH10186 [Drosophila grimshawi]|uniref:GH10186 n=1 Tax=Drosophila grimshawi TaxID=7222 RepID=B4JBV2_DROGR|nr:GH10186 [Drosophila grimshawi]
MTRNVSYKVESAQRSCSRHGTGIYLLLEENRVIFVPAGTHFKDSTFRKLKSGLYHVTKRRRLTDGDEFIISKKPVLLHHDAGSETIIQPVLVVDKMGKASQENRKRK